MTAARLGRVAALGMAIGCAGAPEPSGTRDYWRSGPHVYVRGPWEAITPSSDVDEVIDQLCPAVMELPRAMERDYGQEYCGAIYSLGDGIYHASMPSPLGEPEPVGPSKRKKCIPPRYVADPRGRTVVLGDFHSHPWAPSSLSLVDRLAETQIWTIRIQFDRACTITKLVPNLSSEQPGEVYLRQRNRWKLVGIIKHENKALGLVTTVDD
ncbi:hypothetical protein [Myxococcus xanthus]|uniref:Uncharacterized protein n=1 Tax=Myxococcus xanthus TaxID=34 RepID=A0A7Y4IDC1_MYXXA|nr:hypothetical protein [Myxococcus xanthus]NOJ77191.1 hypothetical protein [Myxococcus xanthus]NOJ88108.1 hypothetical protein [Myxococcus xanthus]